MLNFFVSELPANAGLLRGKARDLSPADYVFGAAVALIIGCNFYFGPRIKRERVAMQWTSDGQPTWSAPKWLAMWGMPPFMVVIRLFIWLASTYAPQSVHGSELGIVVFSVVVAGSHILVLKRAEKAHPV